MAPAQGVKKESFHRTWPCSVFMVSSMCRGHAHFLCSVTLFT